jgi:hypothetical protein
MYSNDFIFTSHCFDNPASGGDYLAQQVRLKQSIIDIYPDANLHFIKEGEEGKPKFQKSLYGFKVDLVKTCLEKGFKKIIFFDTSIVLNQRVDYWFDILPKYGVLCPIDHQKLDGVTSDNCLKYLGLEREQVKTFPLVGGSVYVFDFNNQNCVDVFKMWSDLEENGLFGNQDDLSAGLLQAHRMDETCMALSLALNGLAPVGYDIIKYCHVSPHDGYVQKLGGDYEPIITKRHFK